MSTTSSIKVFLLLIFFVSASGSAYAALYPRDLDGDISNGHEGVYDSDLNITWLAKPCTEFRVLDFLGKGYSGGGCQVNHPVQNWDYLHAVYLPRLNNYDGGRGFWGINRWRVARSLPHDPASFNEFNEPIFTTGPCPSHWPCTYNGEEDIGINIDRPSNELGHLYYVDFGGKAARNKDGSTNESYGYNAASNQEAISLFELDFDHQDSGVAFSINTMQFVTNRESYLAPNCSSSSSEPCKNFMTFSFFYASTGSSIPANNQGVWLVFDGDIAPKNGMGDTSAATLSDGSISGQLLFENIMSLTDGSYYEVVNQPLSGTALIHPELGNWIYKTSAEAETNDFFVVRVTDDNGAFVDQIIEVAVTSEAASKNVPALGPIGLFILCSSLLGLGFYKHLPNKQKLNRNPNE